MSTCLSLRDISCYKLLSTFKTNQSGCIIQLRKLCTHTQQYIRETLDGVCSLFTAIQSKNDPPTEQEEGYFHEAKDILPRFAVEEFVCHMRKPRLISQSETDRCVAEVSSRAGNGLLFRSDRSQQSTCLRSLRELGAVWETRDGLRPTRAEI